ncbi:MAG: hypothetical protein U0136_03410 [Bdellovibrionota bacterium]
MNRALVVSQHMETRLPLVQVLTQSSRFRDVRSVHNIEEANLSVIEHNLFDMIFIAESFGENEIAEFIAEIKRGKSGANTAFVLVMKSQIQDSNTVANNMFGGVHGFLCEPFSLDRVEESVKLALAVRNQSSGVRLRAATGLMLTEVINEIDPSPPSEGDSQKSIWQKVNDNCEKYKILTGESVSMSLIKDIKDARPSERMPKYTGVSNRVRGLLERKFREKIQAFKRRLAD